MSGLISTAFVSWIFALPFLSFFSVQEETVRVSYYLAVSVCTGFILLNWRRIRTDKTDVWYFLWLALLFVSGVFGVNPHNSLLDGGLRGQSVLFFVGLWTLMKTAGMLSASGRKLLARFIFVSALLESMVVVAGSFAAGFIPYHIVSYGRPAGTFGEPNMAAGYLAVAVIFIGLAGVRSGVGILSAAFLSIAVILTGSRAGIISLGISLWGVFGQASSTVWKNLADKRRTLQVFPFFRAVQIAAALFLVAGVLLSVQDIGQTRSVSPVDDRQAIWKTAVSAILRRPWLGYGAESGEQVFREGFYSLYSINLQWLTIDRAHNIILDLFIWSGLSGFVAFSVWVVSVGRRLFASGQSVRIWGIIAWMAYAMFQPPGIVQWVFLALLAS